MFLGDLAYAVRTLRNSPVFAVTAIVTIGLGIGASTAIFSVTNAVLLRPLPYKNPDRLVLACADMRKRDVKDFPLANAEYFDLRDGAKSTFEDFGAVRTGRNILPREDGTPEQVRFAQVTTNFFRLMGARIQFGRDFEDADGQPPPPPPQVAAPNAPLQQPPPAIAILSYEYFQRRYGGNTAILGRRMLNGGQVVPWLWVCWRHPLGPRGRAHRLQQISGGRFSNRAPRLFRHVPDAAPRRTILCGGG